MIEIDEPQIKELEKVVFKPNFKNKKVETIEILRIENEEDFTRIDFICYAPTRYINGGWVEIMKDTFIRPVGTNHKLTLVNAVNIPIAPKKHYFRSTRDMLCYTLYFPPLPKGTTAIDIIESEATGGNWFNFYGVSMERVRSEKLIVGN